MRKGDIYILYIVNGYAEKIGNYENDFSMYNKQVCKTPPKGLKMIKQEHAFEEAVMPGRDEDTKKCHSVSLCF